MIVTCSACGLRNKEGEAACRRCAEPLLSATAAPPAEDLGVWKDGNVLVVRKGGSLPDRCVLCGGRSHSRIDHTYQWHPPALYVLILLSILIYAIVAMVVRKKADVQMSLCRLHAEKRQRGRDIGIGTGFAFVVCLLLGTNYPSMLVAALVVLLVGTVIAIRYRTLPAPTLIDDTLVRLKGVSAAFLLPLPVFRRFP